MDRLMLIVRMADEIVALPADMVGSVVEIEAVTAVPLAPPHVAGLAALRSRVVTIIEPRAVLGLAGRPTPPFAAAIVTIDGHAYGIAVDDVLDVLDAAGPPVPVHGQAAGGWGAVARGLVIVEDRQHLLIDPAALIRGGAPEPTATEDDRR